MKKVFAKAGKRYVFMILILLFGVFCYVTPVDAKTKSFPAPEIEIEKYNNDLGVKVTINKTKKAQGYEVYVRPVETIPLYDGYVADAFYVEGNGEGKLAGTWHEKGEFYKQAEVKSNGEKKQDYYIEFMQAGTYIIKVRAFYDAKTGKRHYSKYSKAEEITIKPDDGGKGLEKSYDFSNVNIGDEFEFGSYEQDGNLKNGYEPVKWQVLSKDDDYILVISKYVLDILPYNTEYADTTWEDSTLREWLNKKFYNAAFNDAERNLISEMTLTNDDNDIYGTKGGNATNDKLFILSKNDLKNTYYGFSANPEENDINRRCSATKYAVASGAGSYYDYTTKEGLGTCYWWVRTPGYEQDYGTYVHDYGCVISDGNNYDFGYVYYSHGVRPAMFIKLKSIDIQQAMDEIVERLEGKFFTVSGTECDSCKGSFKSNHGCENCQASKIVEEEWYKELFPEYTKIDVDHFPNIASGYRDSSYDNDGESCFGFGCWAQWYIYSRVYGEQNFKGQHHLAKGEMTYEFLKNSGAKPGDVLRKGNHTMLLYSYDENGYVIIDSNGKHNGKLNCVVAKEEMFYDKDKKCVISRPMLP